MKSDNPGARPDRLTAGNLMKLPSYVASGVRYHAAGRIYTPKPLYATLHVTRRCDSRCVMCSEWRRQGEQRELGLDEISATLANPLFDSVEKLALSGGEPTLRGDLVQVAEIAVERWPRLREVALLTNGLEPTRVGACARGLARLTGREGAPQLLVQVSIDGYGAVHETIRRVPLAFERATETVRVLKELQREAAFYLCITCVVQPLNISSLVRLSELGLELGVPVSFVPVDLSLAHTDSPAGGAAPPGSLVLTSDQLAELKSLFGHQLRPALKPSNIPFWREYFQVMGGARRRLPCFRLHHHAGIDSDGTLYACARDGSFSFGSALDEPPDKLWHSEKAREARRRVRRHCCPDCTASCDMAFSLTHEFFYYARFLLKEKAGRLLGRRGNGDRW